MVKQIKDTNLATMRSNKIVFIFSFVTRNFILANFTTGLERGWNVRAAEEGRGGDRGADTEEDGEEVSVLREERVHSLVPHQPGNGDARICARGPARVEGRTSEEEGQGAWTSGLSEKRFLSLKKKKWYKLMFKY